MSNLCQDYIYNFIRTQTVENIIMRNFTVFYLELSLTSCYGKQHWNINAKMKSMSGLWFDNIHQAILVQGSHQVEKSKNHLPWFHGVLSANGLHSWEPIRPKFKK
jgi:hypothetical protein